MQTPVEIDTKLASLYEQAQKAKSAVHSAMTSLHYKAGHRQGTQGLWFQKDFSRWASPQDAIDAVTLQTQSDLAYSRSEAERALGAYYAATRVLNGIENQMAPLEAEHTRRQWTRAFLVLTSGHGHVHKSMSCRTCYPTTLFHWFPEWSGRDEAEIVAAAGERACTVCYPSAPCTGPSQFYTQEERELQARREAKAARGPAPTCPHCGDKRPRTKATDRGERLLCSICKYLTEGFGEDMYGRIARASYDKRAGKYATG
jgi:hypothetical protein